MPNYFIAILLACLAGYEMNMPEIDYSTLVAIVIACIANTAAGIWQSL